MNTVAFHRPVARDVSRAPAIGSDERWLNMAGYRDTLWRVTFPCRHSIK